MSFAVRGGDKRGAEHMGANLLPCNAAVRLQARTSAMGGGKESGNEYGKGNRVLHTEHLPEKGDLDPPEQRGKVIEFCLQVKKSA